MSCILECAFTKFFLDGENISIMEVDYKRQTRATCGCMAAGQSLWLRPWAVPRLYAGLVCDDSAAEAAYVVMVALWMNLT